MSTRYFKALREGGLGTHTDFQWALPRGKRPGKWLPKVERLEICGSGYHFVTVEQLVEGGWLKSPIICEVEIRGDVLHGARKSCAQGARLIRRLNWDDRTSRLFACDCAWHVLKIYEKAFPKDKRIRKCIQTARRFANGRATRHELDAAWAAGDAAGDAAWAAWAAGAAGDAARDAAWAAWAAGDAAGAAVAAARAARAAGAAGAAARAAERRWQTKRLLEYLDGKRGVA